MFVMKNIINSVLRSGGDEKLNIVTLCEHDEKYISLLCQTGHNFYIPTGETSSRWVSETCPAPPNLHILGEKSDTPPSFDFIVCHDRLENYDQAMSLSSLMHLPIILVDHCVAPKKTPVGGNFSIGDPERLSRFPDITVSLSSEISNGWEKNGLDLVVPIGIDTERFSPAESRSSNNIFNEKLSPKRVVFDNAVTQSVAATIFSALGRSEHSVLPTDSDILQKEEIYREGDYFVNSWATVTVKLLEAMACGNVPICFRTPDTESFIDHGKDGYLVESPLDLASLVAHLDENPSISKEVGQRARQKIIDNHSIDSFLSKWSHVLSYMRSQFYSIK